VAALPLKLRCRNRSLSKDYLTNAHPDYSRSFVDNRTRLATTGTSAPATSSAPEDAEVHY
jgi:hypothetical protein